MKEAIKQVWRFVCPAGLSLPISQPAWVRLIDDRVKSSRKTAMNLIDIIMTG